MVVSALSFLAGLLSVQQFTVLPDVYWFIAGSVVACIMAWLRYWRFLFFVLGVLWAIAFAMYRLSDRLPEQLEGAEIQVVGTIAGLPEQDEKRARFDFITRDGVYAEGQSGTGPAITRDGVYAEGQSGTGSAITKYASILFSAAEPDRQIPTKLRLSWYYPDQAIKAGQHWAFTVKLKRVHGTMNPGGFDYERWLFTEGIGATGYVRASPKPVLLGRDSYWRNISVWRQDIIDRLAGILVNNSSLALIKALTLGDGSSISLDQWDIFRKTGTTHLVVISGSHIGLVAGLVYFLVLKAWACIGYLKWPPQKIAAISAMFVAVIYSGLAGFSVPTERAVIMLSIAMAAIILQRNTRPLNILSIAMFAILIRDPIAVLSVGFWLSFFAVAMIVYAISGRLGKIGHVGGVIKINWVTSVALSPLLLLFFQQVSLIAPLANLVAVPIISLLVVPLSLCAVLIMFALPMLASKLFYGVDLVLQGLVWLLSYMADMPMASINHVMPSYWALLFAVPGILLLLAPAGMPARWLGLAMFLPLIFTDPKQPANGGIKMTLLDVGQGLSAVVQTRHHLLVYDTGAKFSEHSDIGQSVLLPFLRSQGLDKIDALIISHGDNDHIGGAESLLRSIPVGHVVTSVPQQLSAYSPDKCVAGQSWLWDEVEFTMLSPKTTFLSENDNSCVLKIQAKQTSVLLTGDIEAQAESWLVDAYGQRLQADILVAPHHGSKTSSTINFLRTVQPDYVLIPAGYRNQFGHPHQDVLARYRQINATWLTSADSGAIAIDVENNAFVVHGMRQTESKYWNMK
jgi:competence protein ComEC